MLRMIRFLALLAVICMGAPLLSCSSQSSYSEGISLYREGAFENDVTKIAYGLAMMSEKSEGTDDLLRVIELASNHPEETSIVLLQRGLIKRFITEVDDFNTAYRVVDYCESSQLQDEVIPRLENLPNKTGAQILSIELLRSDILPEGEKDPLTPESYLFQELELAWSSEEIMNVILEAQRLQNRVVHEAALEKLFDLTLCGCRTVEKLAYFPPEDGRHQEIVASLIANANDEHLHALVELCESEHITYEERQRVYDAIIDRENTPEDFAFLCLQRHDYRLWSFGRQIYRIAPFRNLVDAYLFVYGQEDDERKAVADSLVEAMWVQDRSIDETIELLNLLTCQGITTANHLAVTQSEWEVEFKEGAMIDPYQGWVSF